MQSPKQPWQADDGSGAQMCCGELSGPASSAAGRMESTIASLPVKRRRQLSFRDRSQIPRASKFAATPLL
jgi:hypothetical protein